jgi:hypothetical protein
MAVARSLLFAVIVAALPRSLAAPADSGRLVPGPAWEYHFPPGLLDTANFAVTPDYRYLAIVSGRWTYHPKGKPEQAASEGENAIYVLDLKQKRLLWKQVLPEGQVPFIRGISPGAEFTAVEVNLGRGDGTLGWDRDGQQLEGRRLVGPPEWGMRLYDRRGVLIAQHVPLDRSGHRQPCDPLVLRPPEKGEEPVSDELRRRLVAAGVREVSVVPRRELITRPSPDSAAHIAGINPDGSVRWDWPVPPDEDAIGSRFSVRSASSRDGRYELICLDVREDSGQKPPVKRLHFFTWESGLQWSRDFPLKIRDGMVANDVTSMAVSDGARSLLISRGQLMYSAVDILGTDGQTKSQYAFYGIAPVGSRLSPSGKYWAAVLARWAEGPGVDDLGWTVGLHVFSCDTGNVAWRATLPSRSWWKLIALDSGGVIAISETLHTLAVFDPPTSTAK